MNAPLSPYTSESLLGSSIDAGQTIVAPSNVPGSYQSTSDSADSPITSPAAVQCHSPTDHLMNGSIAATSPVQQAANGATSNILIMRDVAHLDDEPYQIAFKQEPNVVKTEQHTF